MKKLKCDIGIIAYNEAANIGKLLTVIQQQKLENVMINKIFVVSSACTDGTDDIVKKFAQEDERIILIAEKERRGKSAAINKFLSAAEAEFLVLESGDTLPAKNTIEKMIEPFTNPKIGMTGGRPVPENESYTFIGYAVNLLWNLHHQMALISPKLGEMVAFRKTFNSIPEDSAVDEASIEAIIREQKLQLQYIPEAIIHNKGPENIADFIKQRRRIEAGHLWLKEKNDYEVSSQNPAILFQIAQKELWRNRTKIFYFLGTVALESYCRLLGWIDYKILKKNPFKWDIADSTKNLEKS